MPHQNSSYNLMAHKLVIADLGLLTAIKNNQDFNIFFKYENTEYNKDLFFNISSILKVYFSNIVRQQLILKWNQWKVMDRQSFFL